MYSRVTLLEIDTLRVDLESALELFRDRVLPKLREQDQTFVIVTHDAGVGKRCHRVVRMSDGLIVGEERN